MHIHRLFITPEDSLEILSSRILCYVSDFFHFEVCVIGLLCGVW